MNVISWFIYIPLQILFIPVALVGTIVVAYKQMVVSKRLGVSQTAIEILNGRWTMHLFGMRKDQACARLATTLPNTSAFGLWLVLLPLWIKYRISGRLALYPRNPEPGEEKILDLVMARTLAIDLILAIHLPAVEQFVLMGAGYDTRAFDASESESLRCFELDQAAVQEHKRAMLQRAGIPQDKIVFVSVDFATDAIFDKLTAAGFDPTKKTLFLWEGVTLYLTEPDVRATIRSLREQAAPGSLLVADIYARRFLKMYQNRAMKKALDYTGEGLDFGLDFETDWQARLEEFVTSESLGTAETVFLGANGRKGPFAVIVAMTVGA